MRPDVFGAIRRRACQAGADGRLLDPRAHVAPNHVLIRRLHKRVGAVGRHARCGGGAVARNFVILRDHSENFVDAQLWTLFKGVFAKRTCACGGRCPVPANTSLEKKKGA